MTEQQQCRTCKRVLPGTEFYANCAECKECKRQRSKNNRLLQARKLAAFERFVDVLITLADHVDEPPIYEAAS